MLACAESDSAQANTAQSRIFREFLRQNEHVSKSILACLSGAQMASIHEIKNSKKSRDTAPLSTYISRKNTVALCGIKSYKEQRIRKSSEITIFQKKGKFTKSSFFSN